ncbi:hypothetical protein F5884DRAFT_891519 [Xylogone sp. PMI_703]|nr:hypothetical protein F5884DRAFT_891519 [Xylogone sp. PMI_703]
MQPLNLIIGILFSTLLVSFSNGLPWQSSRSEHSTSHTTLPTYDYVVVGSGPGGGPLAARLAMAGFKVLLIDAGDDQGTSLQQEIPLLHAVSTEVPAQQWDYFVQHYDDETQQQMDSKFTWQLSDGEYFVGPNPPAGAKPLGILYPRAGTLGGCAGHNALVTTTPQNSDWDSVVSLTGDHSWASGSMKSYWERLEKCNYLPKGTPGHGFDGWFETSRTDVNLYLDDNKTSSVIRAAATTEGKGHLEAKFKEYLTADINNNSPTRDFTEGLYQIPSAAKQPSWKRSGPRDFILQVANAVNRDGSRKYHLDLRLETLVTKIRFDRSRAIPKATGVDFITGKSLYRADPRSNSSSPASSGSVNVHHEVIIAAGTFNTPQLLKLSGVGPAAELKKFNIPVVVDLPGVGTNLMDRYEVAVVAETTTNFTEAAGCTFLHTPDDPCLKQWENNHHDPGYYSSNGLALGLVKKSSVSAPDAADLLISATPSNFQGYFPGYSKVASADSKHLSFLILKAHSRNSAGTVTLLSDDPQDTPNIHFRSFQDGGAEDLQAVYEALQFTRQILGNLTTFDDTFTEVLPGTSVQTIEDLKTFIKNEAWGHHACCTAKIGADNDNMAVLDSKFRVRNTTGLRVVDASAFPQIPGYFIVTAIYMISEKAADVIIADARGSYH